MLRAIHTKYPPWTNTLGQRVEAISRVRQGDAAEISITDNWDASASVEQNHARVAKLLAAKMQWAGLYVGGGLPDDSGFAFVNIGRSDPLLIDPMTRRGVRERDWFIVETQA